jgi:hypothetical protein
VKPLDGKQDNSEELKKYLDSILKKAREQKEKLEKVEQQEQ